ncbi:MAG: hypothetical protein OXL68_18000 [Paracoccaceae bacterium]|nr:hypothetical protein [Paracoccaceae bacterium]
MTRGVRKRRAVRHRYAWQADLRIRDGAAAMPVNRHNVEEIVACGRARWKCENEGYHVLE